MTFTSHTSLSDLVAEQDRPKRTRTDEPAELARRERYEQGICRKVTCSRKRRKGAFCTQHYNEVERNTNRFRGNGRAGRRSIADMDSEDSKHMMRAFVAGVAGLAQLAGHDLTRFERQRHELEPLSQLLLGVKSAFEIAKRRGQVKEWLEAIRSSLSGE